MFSIYYAASDDREKTTHSFLNPLHNYKETRKKSLGEIQPQAMQTAVCEVFQFSDGNIDQLKPADRYKLGTTHKSKHTNNNEKKPCTNNKSFNLHQVDLHLSAKYGRSLSARRRLHCLETMKKFYGNQSLAPKSSIKLPDIHKNSAAIKRQTKSSPAKMTRDSLVISSTRIGASGDIIEKSDNIDWDEGRSKMATRGNSCNSLELFESDSNGAQRDRNIEVSDIQPEEVSDIKPEVSDIQTEAAAPETTDNMTKYELELDHILEREDPQSSTTNRNPAEILKIYHVTKTQLKRTGRNQQRELVGQNQTLGNSDARNGLFEDTNYIQKLTITAQKNTKTSKHIQPESRPKLDPRSPTKSSASSTKGKLPSIHSRKNSSGEMKGADEHKMFVDSYYNQFSHRKLKKPTEPSERKRTRYEAANAISKQYDRTEALHYLKVKIGRTSEPDHENMELQETFGPKEEIETETTLFDLDKNNSA